MTRFDGLIRTPDGDLIPDPEPALEHPPDCRGGLLGWDNPDTTPAPCPVCRPDLVTRLQRQRARIDDPTTIR